MQTCAQCLCLGSARLGQQQVLSACRRVPGGLYGSPSHGGVRRQGGDRAAATRRQNWRPGGTGHPAETNTRLNSRGDKSQRGKNEQRLDSLQKANKKHEAHLQEEEDMWEPEAWFPRQAGTSQ